ncbi:putative glycerophosphodiester phosphodiesterase, protein kinase RLK-Pelle-LRK10L-2 family [Medicago truncatula]|uniref:LRR kinase family protein n=1 Tax=Medicago truncatula TaxID=3880 RepID=G7KUC1_MEDTR|nr:receptor-like kinase TMK4 [Medicago truncatula]AES80571.1 LRR kinase family protein [Medicago truncatula]RHN47251.1 putative glycerophosphodiester phosphodiesterase, protein kinase RLK-Pelle-LRK10L-2 family [Medicago truncatula]
MKTLPQQSVLYYFSILIIVTVTITNGEKDADYMSQLMKALTPTPKGWSGNIHYCKWNGIRCDQSNQVVTAIKLPSSSLTGIIPENFNSLNNLTDIDLHNNSLNGPLPDLAFLNVLQTVNLGYNNFTSIPDFCFGTLLDLTTLNLSNNLNLKPWLFPEELSVSSLIHTLDLEATNLIASLPSDMFKWFPRLHTVFLSHNNLSGTLPPSLGESSIRYLRLNNQGAFSGFTGTIDVISSMRFLSQAWLNNNMFAGPIPNMSSSTNLFDLQLHSNQLVGLVPHSLCTLSSLKNISLDINFLQGPIPVFHEGVNASWEGNKFCRNDVGPCDPQVTILLEILGAVGYPAFVSNSEGNKNDACSGDEYLKCSKGKIVAFYLDGIQAGGTISPAFSGLSSLVNLTLRSNNLTGSIPHSLTTLSQLQLLDVSDNNLTGQVPKFSSNVNLITTGNPLLGKNISQQLGGGENTTASRDGGSSKTTIAPAWIVGASLLSAGFVILIVILCKRERYLILVKRWILRKTTKSIDNNVEDFIQSYNLSVPIKQYRYAEVKKMTNSFRDKLGQGGYGVVYKANLPDGRQVAVKIINESKGNGEDFINEVASISRTSHVNIVSLLGFCYENKRALIYEFLPKGSLDKFILKSGFHDAICSLDWKTLYQIAIGIARGLEYLHQGCISRILHLDIKPQNILLDENFCPKISDFGLAKVCQRNDSIVSLLGTRGTIGYIAPEVFSRTYGGVSHKSDVYSYGMLILEMVGGRKNYDTGGSCTSEMCFPDWIYKDLEQANNLANCLANSKEENDMVRMITMVSLWCIQTNPADRPSMSKVLEMLQGPLQSVPYPPKPFLYSPALSSLQTSYLSSSNLLETNSAS